MGGADGIWVPVTYEQCDHVAGPFEDDPNVTNKRFPGNVTQSYRSVHPLRIVGEVESWTGHDPEVLQGMLDHLASLRAQGLDVIED